MLTQINVSSYSWVLNSQFKLLCAALLLVQEVRILAFLLLFFAFLLLFCAFLMLSLAFLLLSLAFLLLFLAFLLLFLAFSLLSIKRLCFLSWTKRTIINSKFEMYIIYNIFELWSRSMIHHSVKRDIEMNKTCTYSLKSHRLESVNSH